MNDFEMLFADGRIAFERSICRSPKPDAIFSDTGNQSVVDKPTETFDKPNWPAAAKCYDRAIEVLNRKTVMIGQLRESRYVDWIM